MANLKSLAKDTAIYGMSSIIGRFLNYLLVPLYTAKISGERRIWCYHKHIRLYSPLTGRSDYGMETTFLPLRQ